MVIAIDYVLKKKKNYLKIINIFNQHHIIINHHNSKFSKTKLNLTLILFK